MIGKVEKKLEEGVGTIEFFSPKANSLTREMLKTIIDAVDSLSLESACSVIVIRSEADVFCGGASLEQVQALATRAEATEFFTLFGRVTLSVRRSPKPVVVRVQGKAVGGGVGIVASGDYSIGTASAAFRLPEFSVGIAPFAISPVLEWRIGSARTLELSLSGEFHDSAWARTAGLLTCVVSDEKELDEELERLTRKFKGYPREAVSKFKGLLASSLREEEILARAQHSAEALIRTREGR